MSFSKARIQRFNELGSEAPPPGAYDPKFDNKVKGSVIEKSDRFLDAKSTSSAECNASIASGKSNTTTSTSLFRAPQLPRKRLITESAKTKNGHTFLNRNQNMKYESNQQLADLQVECLNKDKTIQEHERHIEEMKEDVRKLEAEIEKLHKKQNEMEMQHTEDIEAMAKLQQEIINNHDNKHQAEAQLLRSQLLEVSEEKEREISMRKTMETELRNHATELSRRIIALEAELCAKKEENKTMIENLEIRIEELLNTLKAIKHDHDTKIGLLQKEKSQLDVCVTNLTQEQSNLESKLEIKQNVILEIQAQLSALQCELDELKVEYEKLANDSIKRISDLTDKHEKEIQHLKNDFMKEKEKLLTESEIYKTCESEAKAKANEIEETNCFLVEELEDLQRLYKDVCHRLQQAQTELDLSNEKHIITVEKYKQNLNDLKNIHIEDKLQLEQLLENTKKEHLIELENITLMRDKELDELKQTITRTIEEETIRIMKHAEEIIKNAESDKRNALAACRAENKEQIKKVIVECDAKVSGPHINAMMKETQNTVEDEMRLTNERYKACLVRMELEHVVLDEKLSQKDAEIAKLSATLEDLRQSIETQESFSQSLQIELDKAETELAEKKEELRALKDRIRTEGAEMVARKKKFELITADNKASLIALTNRLAQSNAEVEKLQDDLKHSEVCIRKHRDLLSAMRNSSQLVDEQIHIVMKELDTHRELVDQHQINNLSQFESIKSIFETQIEDLKQKAAKEIARLQNDFEQKSLQNDELKKQLDEMSKKLHDVQNLLLDFEEQTDAQKLGISRLELANSKLLEQLKSQEKDLEKNKQLLEDQAAQHKTITDMANGRIEELSQQLELKTRENDAEVITLLLEQERIKWRSLENIFAQQLQEEKARREEAEEEVKRIIKSNDHLKKDYEEISDKYAEIIGHQNPKQRIKHVTHLKEKNNHLEQEVRAKIKIIEQQQKTIEKLKAEERRSHWKGKENVGMVHSNPLASPHKTLTPLRSRND
ncbi:putative leucine-rich repeat-containing protein DDB_G0290503 isoform X1 [Polyergus mexicanus]|uniref:putative leucine-rich repeat-containing protein DDB_G0290503 isoform X1 n=1 Tax=Polyergus mexicanus TaxID=615972 RepID=UPI0038B5E103